MTASALDQRVSELERQLQSLRADTQHLLAHDAIRGVVYRFCRGLDRLDKALMASAFHDDASVDYGALFKGPAAAFIDFTVAFQAKQRAAQHLVGNILIDVRGDSAVVETYELGRHWSAMPDGEFDMILAGRCLDRFALRDGHWKIAERRLVVDWARRFEMDEPFFSRIPVDKGTRDRLDPSYSFLPSP